MVGVWQRREGTREMMEMGGVVGCRLAVSMRNGMCSGWTRGGCVDDGLGVSRIGEHEVSD